MIKMSEQAINECVAEIHAASGRPVDQAAIDLVVSWVRPDFERILDRVDGQTRWARVGPRVRETGHFLGALGDFFASHLGSHVVGTHELTEAIKMTRADCTVRAERTPVAWEFCPHLPVGIQAAEEYLRTVALEPELLEQAV